MSTIAIGSPRTVVRRPARRPAVAAPVTAPAVRLTRRGRLVLLLALVAVAFTMLAVFGAQSAATGESGAPVETRTVEVGEGDSLWQIAATVADSGEVQEMIHQIEELNALSGVGLVEGEEIAVPVS